MVTSLDGLVTGLDTAALIRSLMAVEAIPQQLLVRRVSTTESRVTALQALNTRLAALAESAATAAATGVRRVSATSSDASATVVVAPTAAPGSIDLAVTQTASGHALVTAAMADWPDAPPVITLTDSAGVATEIAAASTSLADVANAINAAGAGVTATVVTAGTDASGNPLQRLQLSSAATGAAAAFTAHRGTAADVAAGTAVDLASEPGAASVRTAQDARILLWQGTAAEQEISSATGVFTDLLPGVAVTAVAVSASPVRIDVVTDAGASTEAASALVQQLAQIVDQIASGSRTTTTKSADGGTITRLGPFTSDSTVRQIRDALAAAMSGPVDGRSPSDIGIGFDKNGTLQFDAEKFRAALASDPARVERVMGEISTRSAAAATAASDRFTGTLTSAITGQKTLIRGYTQQIESWDARLTKREASLKRTYAALEVAISRMNTQMAQLSGQLASLAPPTR